MDSFPTLALNLVTTIYFICGYVIGLYLCSKIIICSLKDKEAFTWKLDVANSICLIVHFTHVIFMNAITYVITDVYIYTGKWICYASKLLTYMGRLHLSGHSFFISFLKYLIIVKWKTARAFGHSKLIKIFLWMDLILYSTCWFLLRLASKPDFFWTYSGFIHVERCLGDVGDSWAVNSTNKFHPGNGHCLISEVDLFDSNIEYALYIFKVLICYTQLVFTALITLNIFEMAFYCRTFSFMRR